MSHPTDRYLTLAAHAEGQYSEKRSRFLAFALPVAGENEVKEAVREFRKRYYDARHVCYAYTLGHDGERFRAVDDGEPSGTGGRPILGQIRSRGLTFTLVVVVRYFGGIQLGAANLGTAYKTAAAAALEAAPTEERIVTTEVRTAVPYPDADALLRLGREAGARIARQEYDATEQRITFAVRLSEEGRFRESVGKLYTVRLLEEGEDNRPPRGNSPEDE